MLSCKDVAEQASEYLEHPNWRLRWQMRLHLAMCSNCRRFVRHLQATRALAARIAPLEPISRQKSEKIVQILRSKP